MDIVSDLLPSMHKLKSVDSSTDKKQRNNQNTKQSNNQNKQRQKENNQLGKLKAAAVIQTQNYDDRELHVEKRSGEDRRNGTETRGRWLESRINQDRRKNISINVQI